MAGLARNQFDIYDGKTFALLHRVPARSMPSHMNFAPDSSVVYVSLQDTDSLMAVETATGHVLWTTKVGKTPAGVLWHDGHILVGDMGSDYVAVVDPADGKVVRKVKTGRAAHNLFMSPDGHELYVTNRVAGTISVLDPNTLDVERSYSVPGGPDDISFAPDGMIWAGLRFPPARGRDRPQDGQLHHHPHRPVAARDLAEHAAAAAPAKGDVIRSSPSVQTFRPSSGPGE